MGKTGQMKNPVKYGIVGVGGFGAQRRERLRKCGAFEIVGGVDTREESFTKADAEEGRQLRRYASVDELVADPAVEAVFIATSANLHVPQAMIAAKAGKAGVGVDHDSKTYYEIRVCDVGQTVAKDAQTLWAGDSSEMLIAPLGSREKNSPYTQIALGMVDGGKATVMRYQGAGASGLLKDAKIAGREEY